jgi:hypothetical protein
VPDHLLQSENVTLKRASKPHAATLTRGVVHAVFTPHERYEAPLQSRSAFASSRVKSARICRLAKTLGPLPAHENRFEI